MVNSFVQHKFPPRSKFVLQFHYLSSADTELVGEFSDFGLSFYLGFYVYITQYLVQGLFLLMFSLSHLPYSNKN